MVKWFLISFTLFVFFLLFSSIKVIFEGSLGPNENKIICEFQALYGLIHTEMRLKRFESMLNGTQHLLKGLQQLKRGALPLIGEFRPGFDIRSIPVRIRITLGMLKKRRLNRWLYSRLNRGIAIEEFRWQTAVGTEDAMDTALAAGALWSTKTMILGYLSSRVPIMKCSVRVDPDYTKPIFHTGIRCAVRLKVLHLIIGLIIISSAVRGIGIQKS